MGWMLYTKLTNTSKIQNEPSRIVTGLTRSVSLENMYKECEWASLSQIRHQHTLSFMYYVNTDMVQDLIPHLVRGYIRLPLEKQ